LAALKPALKSGALGGARGSGTKNESAESEGETFRAFQPNHALQGIQAQRFCKSLILLWLQKEPDITAKDLLRKLDGKYPGQFGSRLLRTLQRRIGEWRGTMARRLVFGGVEERNDVQAVAAIVSVAG
jgi:hypothetical protein